jgi:hypothetical protein
MPPMPWMYRSRGTESALYAAAYRITRDHLLRVRLSALAGSAVHRMTAANGSSRSDTFNRCKRRARVDLKAAYWLRAKNCLASTAE